LHIFGGIQLGGKGIIGIPTARRLHLFSLGECEIISVCAHSFVG
jgi:hypothetical protein